MPGPAMQHSQKMRRIKHAVACRRRLACHHPHHPQALCPAVKSVVWGEVDYREPKWCPVGPLLSF